VAKQFAALDEKLSRFIAAQHIFFTASAAAGTRVNVSPRSTRALRILGPRAAAYLDLTGSGNETAAHLKADGRLTLMFCSFTEQPMILRLYGQGTVFPRGSEHYRALLDSAFGSAEPAGARQIVQLDVDLVQTSCGYAVPFFDYVDERSTLNDWAERRRGEMASYWREKNVVSMDGLPTGILESVDAASAPA
jgi:hypothetical protein